MSGSLSRAGAWRLALPVVVGAALLLAVRSWMAVTPFLSETYYDEATTGLMSLAILRGVPQVFYWGQPYLGAVDAYLAALGFWLAGPRTLVLRLSVAIATLLWMWGGYSLARRIAGEAAGWLAALYLAMPPVFLAYVQLSSHGEAVAMSCATAALALAAGLVDGPSRGSGGRWLTWAGLGLLAGLAWWGTQMTAMVLLAAALAVLTARPGALRAGGPWVALGAFLLGSAPFWAWNATHEWSTFRHLLSWGIPPPSWGERLTNFLSAFLASAGTTFWDGRSVPMSPAMARLASALAVTFYLPAALLAAGRAIGWGRRIWRRQRPIADALDAVALAFWLTVAAHLLTWFGTSGVVRYSMTLYAPVPVLGVVALARTATWGRTARVASIAVAVALLAFHGVTTLGFVRLAEGHPQRPVDAALSRLDALGLDACYADSRVAQVLTFESAGRVTCADFFGYRDYATLGAVDAWPDPARIALVAHRGLQSPAPSAVAAALAALGVESRREELGDYHIFHAFRAPPGALEPISPTGWSARASADAETAPRAFDRRVWTRWVGPQTPGAWFVLDLGRVHVVEQVTLEGGLPIMDAPTGLILDTSTDGARWEPAVRLPDVLPGLSWWRGRPRLDESARLVLRLPSRPARFLRLVHAGRAIPGHGWGLSEVFVYEAGVSAWTPPPAAVTAVEDAERALAHWMDDPTGSHPRRAPVTYLHRRAQVDWAAVSRAVNRALAVAPDWEEPHHLYSRVIDLARWTVDPELVVEEARRDRAWPEVVRWTEMAEADHPWLWRSGREQARIEALRELGHAADAAGLVTRLARTPSISLHAEFGPGLVLVGLDLPGRGCPGQPLRVAGSWQRRGRVEDGETAFLHLSGPGGFTVNLDHRLGRDVYPTWRWAAGEEVRQTESRLVPPEAPPGEYAVRVGVWLPDTGKQLRVQASDRPRHGRVVEVGTISIGSGPSGACQVAPAPRRS